MPSLFLATLETLAGAGLGSFEATMPTVVAAFGTVTVWRTCYYHLKYIKPVKKELDRLSEIEGID